MAYCHLYLILTLDSRNTRITRTFGVCGVVVNLIVDGGWISVVDAEADSRLRYRHTCAGVRRHKPYYAICDYFTCVFFTRSNQCQPKYTSHLQSTGGWWQDCTGGGSSKEYQYKARRSGFDRHDMADYRALECRLEFVRTLSHTRRRDYRPT